MPIQMCHAPSRMNPRNPRRTVESDRSSVCRGLDGSKISAMLLSWLNVVVRQLCSMTRRLRCLSSRSKKIGYVTSI